MIPGVGTSRARVRGLCSFMEVAAVEAPPGDFLVPGEHLALLYIILKSQVALLVLFFSHGNGIQYFCVYITN